MKGTGHVCMPAHGRVHLMCAYVSYCVRMSADSVCVYALERRCVYAHGLFFHIGAQHATEFLHMRAWRFLQVCV